MEDFFRNNPIALRHCLLYEFIYQKFVRKPQHRFYKIMGWDIISIGEYKFWFRQFEQGKFGDNKGPYPDMRDFLRNDKYSLRASVLHEVLKAKFLTTKKNERMDSTLKIYNNFCKVVGDDVMEYREFDFWFYRFLNGEVDLNFERDKDKKIYELIDMPIDIMENIVEYLNIFDRMALLKTSRSLHTFVKNHKLIHHSIKFQLFADNWALFQFEGLGHSISYRRKDNGCERKRKLIDNVSFWKKALQDLENFFQYPKLHLNNLQIRYDLEHEHLFELKAVLDSARHLNIKELALKSETFEPLLEILPTLKPGDLTKIEIFISKRIDSSMEKVFEMDQWKQAKCFTMEYITFVDPLIHLYHFKEFNINLSEWRVENIREMKEILFKSPDFEKCRIRLENPLDMDAIRYEFGNAIQGKPNTCHYPISNSTEYFEIKTFILLYPWSGEIKIQRKKI